MTSSDESTPQVSTSTMSGSTHSVNTRGSLSILDFKEKERARDDISTGDENSFAETEDDQSVRKDGRKMLDESMHSFTLQHGGDADRSRISPCASISSVVSSKKTLGTDLKQLMEKQKKGERRKSQLTLLVNDSASGALFDDVYDMGDVLGESTSFYWMNINRPCISYPWAVLGLTWHRVYHLFTRV